MRNETKVGLLVVVALVALGWLSVKSGSFGLGGSGAATRQLSSIFNDVAGLKEGSPVRMAGVDIGQVSGLQLQPNGTAILRFSVRKDVKLPADVTAQITTSGLIGDRFVSLVPGPQGMQGQGGYLADNVSVIPSTGVADAQQMGSNFAKVADDLSSMTSTLRQVLGSPENAAKLQQIIDGLASFSGTLGSDTSGTMANISRMAANFEKISEQIASGKGTLGQLIMGGGEGGDGLAGAAGSLADLGQAAKEFREVMAKINSGEGTVGKLVNDPATAEKLDHALDTFAQVSDRIEQLRTEVALEGTTLTNEQGIGNGNLTLTLQPRPTRFYTVGLNADGFATSAKSQNDITGPYYGKDFGNKSKITAQFGQVFQNAVAGQDVSVRAGLKNSTGGVGVDTAGKLPYFGNNVKYSADVYDFSGNNTPGGNGPHVDVAARADLVGNMVYGVVGYDNLLNQEYGSPVVGVGVKFQDDDLKYIVGKTL